MEETQELSHKNQNAGTYFKYYLGRVIKIWSLKPFDPFLLAFIKETLHLREWVKFKNR